MKNSYKIKRQKSLFRFVSFWNSISFLRSAFYPDRCVLCDRVIKHKTQICSNCKNEKHEIQGLRCIKCGMNKDECECNGVSTFFDGFATAFKYDTVVKKGIRKWKYENAIYNTEFFADKIIEAVNSVFGNVKFDYITFVPQSDTEESAKAWNQSEILAKTISMKMYIPCKPLLIKIFETNRQHNLKLHLKSGNVFGVFECVDDELIKNKTILVIDDVKTSGKTLNECAKMLKIYDANAVYCATIAATEQREKR